MIIWPGEIAEGNGKELIVIDERADANQREALRKIILGETGATPDRLDTKLGENC